MLIGLLWCIFVCTRVATFAAMQHGVIGKLVRRTPRIGLPVHMNATKAGQTLAITGQIGMTVDVCDSTTFTAAVDVHRVVRNPNRFFMDGSA